MLEGASFQPAGRTAQFARLLVATAPQPFPLRRRARFERLVALCDRNEIEDAVEALIGYLDARTGDADAEDDERGSILMISPGIDWAPDDAPLPAPDDLPGDPEDAEVDDDGEDEDEDCCAAGDDRVHGECSSSYSTAKAGSHRRHIGDEDDAELSCSPPYRLNQTLDLILVPAND